jgi:hypothetical protein
MSAIANGLLVLETKFHQWSKISMIKEPHVGEVILLAKEFAGIFKIERI